LVSCCISRKGMESTVTDNDGNRKLNRKNIGWEREGNWSSNGSTVVVTMTLGLRVDD